MKSKWLKQKWMSVSLLIMLLLPLLIGVRLVGANPPTPPDFDREHQAYQRLFEQYDLVDIDKVPEGITPVVINSPADLERLMRSGSENQNNDVWDQMSVKEITIFTDQLVSKSLPGAATRTSYTTLRRECTVPVGFATFYTAADIRVGVYGTSYAWIDSVNEWVGLRGCTLGFDLTHTYHHHYLTTTTTDITGGGIVDYYLVVNGGIKLWSQPVECSIHYSIY